ncbi:hypothetical protein [Sphingomonas sp.]|uniref:hypothetical protein n=1 Tax=Sphingomonas sp. TaxID=28214 RepID=UPI00181CC6E3|nr:hypothetical protein [Sphingomonas sp.]MBA3511941.1 hypothetical protein [Sphingomonas sp.]
MAILVASVSASCERRSDVIYETSPFMTVLVATPPYGGAGIKRRAENFASSHEMRTLYSEEHFSPGEFSLLISRPDLNIAAENVLRGQQSIVRAYVRGEPSAQHREQADEFLCKAMLHDC